MEVKDEREGFHCTNFRRFVCAVSARKAGNGIMYTYTRNDMWWELLLERLVGRWRNG